MMEAVEVYLMYCAMKAHFGKGDYDYVKYGGKSSATKKSFWKRNDRYFFVRILRKYKEEDVIKDYLISNFIKNKKGWLGDFNDENYIEWKRKIQSITHIFEEELTPLLENFEEGKNLLATQSKNHPKLLKEYLGKRVSIETVIILDDIIEFSNNWDKVLSDDVIWPDVKKMMDNYKKFLTYDKNKCKMILMDLIKGVD